MKRTITFIMMLVLMLCVGTRAWAASYDVWIAGIQVTDANKDDIRPSGLTSGKITFSGSVLTFTNVTLTSAYYACIENKLSGGLQVRFLGTNTLTATNNGNVIQSKSELTLNGVDWNNPAKVTLNCDAEANKGCAAIFQNCSEALKIWNLYLTANSTSKYAITGSNGMISTSCSEVTATAKESAVSYFSSWDRNDYGEFDDKCTYSNASKNVLDASGNVAQKCRLMNGLYIGAAMPRITSKNTQTISPAEKTAGTVTWTGTDTTLELNDVTFSSSTGSVFVRNVGVSGLTIKLTGVNTVTSPANSAFVVRVNTTFAGDGSLRAYGARGISVPGNAKVTINVNNTVRFEGEFYGYTGNASSPSNPDCDLALKKAGAQSDYYFKGGNASIDDCSHLLLSDMDFYYNSSYGTPGCYFDENTHNVKQTGGEVVKGSDVNIYRVNEWYPIYICGKQLNDCNCNGGLGSPYLVDGTVKLKKDVNTVVTLDCVTIDATAANNVNAIKVDANAGTVALYMDGDCEMTTASDVLDLASDILITSMSRINMTSTNASGISTRNSASVIFESLNRIKVKGARYGYWGNGGNTEVLKLVKASSDTHPYVFDGAEGAIYNVKSLVLDNMDFWDGSIYLRGCYFDAISKHVRQNGGTLAKGAIAFGSIQEVLPIYICGQQLNRVNSEEATIYVGSRYISSGTESVGYNPSTKTLTLNNATINYNPGSYVNVGVIETSNNTTLNVNVTGTNNVQSSNAFAGIWLRNSKATIEGDGSLYVAGNFDDIYAMDNSTLTIQGDAKVDAMINGIGSNNDAKELIVGGNAVVRAKQISHVKALTLLDDHQIVQPAGAQFSASDKAIMLNGSKATNVVIDKAVKYGLVICEVPVTNVNCDDILGDGAFCYNDDTKTLTVTNANINRPGLEDMIVNQRIEDLNIVFEGDNNFYVGDDIMVLRKSTTISGTGTVTAELKNSDGYGIWLLGTENEDLDLTINGGTFLFKAYQAVAGQFRSAMTMNGGKLIFEPMSVDYCGIDGLTSLTLGDGMYFYEPNGAYYDTELKGVTLNGVTKYTGSIVIQKAEDEVYSLSIAGTQVTSANCDDILGDGAFCYNGDTKTLTVSGDCSYNDWIIDSQIEGLTIYVASNSTLIGTSSSSIIRLFKTTTITGGVLTLDCTGEDGGAFGIYISEGTLTLDHAQINVIGNNFQYGITGTADLDLFINYSDIEATSYRYGAIYDWRSITLTGCYVVEPYPWQFTNGGIANSNGHVVGNGSIGTVTISTDPDAINTVNASEATASSDVYDLTGRKLNQTGHGINIIRQKDGHAVKVLRK